MAAPSQRKQRKEMTVDERMCCFTMMFSNSNNGQPRRGDFCELAQFFSVESRAISWLWHTTTTKLNLHIAHCGPESSLSFLLNKENFRNGAHGKRGRPRKWDRDALKAATKEVPLSLRKDFRALSSELSVPKSTLFDAFTKEKVFVRHTSR